MIVFLLVLIAAVLLFGPKRVKLWLGGGLAVVVFLLVPTLDGALSAMFSNFWLWLTLTGCAAGAWFQGWGRSVEQFRGKGRGPGRGPK